MVSLELWQILRVFWCALKLCRFATKHMIQAAEQKQEVAWVCQALQQSGLLKLLYKVMSQNIIRNMSIASAGHGSPHDT